MDPTQICTGGGTLCPWGEGSWPFCFGPEKTQKREESGLKNFCIPIFLKVVRGNPIKHLLLTFLRDFLKLLRSQNAILN